MKKILKAKQKKFVKDVHAGLVKLGGVVTHLQKDDHTIFEFNSIVGKLKVILYNDHDYCYTLFAIFDEPSKAKEKFDCNPHSGKYNLHITKDSILVEEAVEQALMHIECALPNNF